MTETNVAIGLSDDKYVIVADEDQHSRRDYISEIEGLTEREIHEVGSGQELVERVREEDYCLVLTSDELTELGGLEAIKAIRLFDLD